jgi:hypothetical protein
VTPAVGAVIAVPSVQSTIQAGIDAALDGDTVLVAPGTYGEALFCFGRSVVIASSDGPETTFLNPPALTSAVLIDHCPDLMISGFTFISGGLNATVLVRNGSVCTIERCWFLDLSPHDVIRGAEDDVVRVRYCLFARCSYGGNLVVTSGANCEFVNNTVHGGNRGLAIYGENAVIENNIIANLQAYAISSPHPSTVIDYNDVWQNNPDYAGVTPGPNSISLDPIFTNPAAGVYSLQAGSPCIDMGNPDLACNDPDGTRNDMGAIPFGGFAPQPPVLLGLTVGSSGDNLHVLDHTPTISWMYVDQWGLPQVQSEVEVGTDDDWATAELWDPPVVAGDQMSIEYAGGALDDGAMGYVRVRVASDSFWSEWMITPFRMNTPPTMCIPLFPPPEAVVLIGTPTLVTMNSTDPDGDSLVYDYLVSLDSNHAQIVATAIGVPEGFGQTDWTIDSLSTENRLHYWRARASDGFQGSPWSERWSFWLDGYNEPPDTPVPVSPSNGEAIEILHPRFEWEVSIDPDPGATVCYHLALSLDPDLIQKTVIEDIDSTFLDWPDAVEPFRQYWWTITADDGRDGTATTEVQSFFVEIDCYCPHQSDFDEDGFVDVLDLGSLIDALFAGAPDPIDPGCPTSRGDFDCDGFSTVLDVGELLDHLFASAPEPCNPCGP